MTPPSPPAPRTALRRRARYERPDRLHVVLSLAVALGVVTGLAVALFEAVVAEQAFARVLDLPLWLAAGLPTVGLLVAVVTVHWFGGHDAATTDAYIRAYHERDGELRLRRLPARLAACAATLGSGGALGYEGPSVLIGGSLGSFAERRFTGRFRQDDAKILMVAGAAAGVAAVFKAPLTGVIFALEVPYHQDLARRAMLPALVAAGTSYLSFVAVHGTEPLFAFGGAAPFDGPDLLGGVAVGVLCGLLARSGAWAVRRAKHLRVPLAVRLPLAGAALFALALATDAWFGERLSLGSGSSSVDWAGAHADELGLLLLLFAIRFAATWLTVAGGGVGGLFVPLVVQGALTGFVVQSVVDARNPGLLPVVGIAAFLGGGYRTPLAGVAFVAEATGRPGFVVPALLAAAASQLCMGRWSFSPHQRAERTSETVALDQLRLDEIMSPNPEVLTASTPLDVGAQQMMVDHRRWVPVVDDDGRHYLGLLSMHDVALVSQDGWSAMCCGDVARTDVRAVGVELSVAEAGDLIRRTGAGAVAVVDDGAVVGVVTLRDLANVERLLDRLAPEDGPGG